MRRYQEAGEPADGALSFTLHAFLRSMGRQADGRTYEQLRGALTRLERTVLAVRAQLLRRRRVGRLTDVSFTLLSSVMIERRRSRERDQLALFPGASRAEPGEARVVISPRRATEPAGATCRPSERRRAISRLPPRSRGASTG